MWNEYGEWSMGNGSGNGEWLLSSKILPPSKILREWGMGNREWGMRMESYREGIYKQKVTNVFALGFTLGTF